MSLIFGNSYHLIYLSSPSNIQINKVLIKLNHDSPLRSTSLQSKNICSIVDIVTVVIRLILNNLSMRRIFMPGY